jgi:hypothetical protein
MTLNPKTHCKIFPMRNHGPKVYLNIKTLPLPRSIVSNAVGTDEIFTTTDIIQILKNRQTAHFWAILNIFKFLSRIILSQENPSRKYEHFNCYLHK